MNALIGHTGFVGSNLREQYPFDAFFRSTDIGEIADREFDLVVCAGVQAKKWWAGLHPEEDWNGIQRLLDALGQVRARTMVLISTVDVYGLPIEVNESSPAGDGSHVYGRHRFAVEEFVRERFPCHHILRLPGLFGRGLKKNVIFDLIHGHELEKIHPGGVYQYYGLHRLREDIDRCREADLRRLNLATEPIATSDLVNQLFPQHAARIGHAAPPTAGRYDMQTEHAGLWPAATAPYLYDRQTILREIGEYVASYSEQEAT